MKMTAKLGMLFTLASGMLMPLTASTAAWDFTAVGSMLNNGTGYSLGEVFVPTANFSITGLGYFAATGPGGFAESHIVSIYDGSGNLLATATIGGGSLSQSSGASFAFSPITPISLMAGETYVIDGASGVIDPYAWNDAGFAIYAPITLLGDNWTGNGGGAATFTGTSVVGDVSDGYWGPNFIWNAGPAIPEPTSFLLVGSALIAAGVLLRRKRSV